MGVVRRAAWMRPESRARRVPIRVVFGGNPLGQMLGRHRSLSERDAQGVRFRIVANYHVSMLLIEVGVYRNDDDLVVLLDEDRANLLVPILDSVPHSVESEPFPAFCSVLFRRLPSSAANCFFHLRQCESSPA